MNVVAQILIPPCGGSKSSRPSHAVRSLLCDFRVGENRRHSRGLGGRAESLVSKFRNFRSGLVASWRQSLLTIFQFPFRHARDRFDI